MPVIKITNENLLLEIRYLSEKINKLEYKIDNMKVNKQIFEVDVDVVQLAKELRR